MRTLEDKVAEVIEEAFALASERRWQQIRSAKSDAIRFQLLAEEDAATNAKRKVLTIITERDQDG